MKSTVFLMAICLLISCSSTKEKKIVQDKIAHEEVSDGKSLGEGILNSIKTSTTLSQKQKDDLEKVITETRIKNKALLEESFKARSVLLKELIANKPQKRQIRLLKKQIKKIEGMRLENTFATIDKFSFILADDELKEHYLNDVIYLESRSR